MPEGSLDDSAVMLGFAELEFLYANHERWPLMRQQLSGKIPDSSMVAEAGAASLLARQLAAVNGEGLIHVSRQVELLTSPLVDSPCPIGVAMGVGTRMAPAVYCPTAAGVRGLVSIEAPGVGLFQLLDADQPVVDQAMGLVEKAAAVGGAIVAVKAIGKAGCLIRRQGESWQLGDDSKGLNDPDVFFQPSTQQAALGVVREYLTINLVPVIGLVS